MCVCVCVRVRGSVCMYVCVCLNAFLCLSVSALCLSLCLDSRHIGRSGIIDIGPTLILGP